MGNRTPPKSVQRHLQFLPFLFAATGLFDKASPQARHLLGSDCTETELRALVNPGELMIATSVLLSRVWAAWPSNQSLQSSKSLEVTGAMGIPFQSATAGVGTGAASGLFVDSIAVGCPFNREMWPAVTARDLTWATNGA